MGFGDVKLSFVLGLDLGWLGVGEIVLGLFLGFVYGAVDRRAAHRHRPADPQGPRAVRPVPRGRRDDRRARRRRDPRLVPRLSATGGTEQQATGPVADARRARPVTWSRRAALPDRGRVPRPRARRRSSRACPPVSRSRSTTSRPSSPGAASASAAARGCASSRTSSSSSAACATGARSARRSRSSSATPSGRSGQRRCRRHPGATEKPLRQPRPGHADLVGMQKYGFDDARDVLERASARETAARVAAGALAKLLLAHLDVAGAQPRACSSAPVRAAHRAAPEAGRPRDRRRVAGALLRPRRRGRDDRRGRGGREGRRLARRRRRGARLRRPARARLARALGPPHRRAASRRR